MKNSIKLLLYACLCGCFTVSCTNEQPPEDDAIIRVNYPETPKDTTVTIAFAPRYDMRPMTRAALSGTVTKLDVWIYQGDTQAAVVNQSSTDDNFGTISVTLDKTKTYTLYAVAHKGDAAATIEDGIISFPDDKVKDTFWYTATISPATATNYSCEMARIVAAFRIETADAVPATVKKIRITQGSVYDRWNVSTGATHQLDRISTITISSLNNDGTVALTVYSIASDSETLHTMTVDALDASDAPIQTRTFANVPLRNGYKTTYRGEFFTNTNTSAAFSLTADWNEYDTVIY